MRLCTWDLATLDACRRGYYLELSGFGYALQPCGSPEFRPLNNQLGRWECIAGGGENNHRARPVYGFLFTKVAPLQAQLQQRFSLCSATLCSMTL